MITSLVPIVLALAFSLGPLCGQGYFQAPTSFAALGTIPETDIALNARSWPIAGDVNNDGVSDLVFSGYPVACALGLGGGVFGSFIAPYPQTAPSWPSEIRDQLVDFDGDGNMDLFGSLPATGQYCCFLGDGAGNFAPSPPVSTGGSLQTDIGDLDNDGLPEIVGVSGTATNIFVTSWKFVGGSWIPWQSIWGFAGVFGCVVGDFDGDGRKDIAVNASISAPGAPSTPGTFVLRSNGPGQGYLLHGPLPDVGSVMTAADLNNDGCDDLVTPGPAVCLGHPQLILSSPVALGYSLSPPTLIHTPGLFVSNTPPRIVDVNLDGNLDWVWVTSAYSGNASTPFALQIRVLLGNGDGTFGPDFDEDEALSGATTANVGIADADGDGDPDLIFARNLCASFAPCGAEWSIAWNDTILGAGTAGSGGLVPRLDLPSAPFPGNAGFRVDLSQAWPLDAAFLALSMAPSVGSFPGNWWLDLKQLVLPTTSIGATMTNSVGDASFPTPIPPDTIPGVRGLEVYIQWAVRDPAGSFTTNGIDSFAFSNARKIVVW